jgi:hypothetical protein
MAGRDEDGDPKNCELASSLARDLMQPRDALTGAKAQTRGSQPSQQATTEGWSCPAAHKARPVWPLYRAPGFMAWTDPPSR